MELDIQLAWQRIKLDLKERNFVKPVFLPAVIQSDLETWLGGLKHDFEAGNYQPHSMDVVEIPKGKGLIRPGSLLHITDNLFFTALVQECYQSVLQRVSWSQNKVDFAYIMTDDNIRSRYWFQYKVLGWTNFRTKSIEAINKGAQYVIITDITGFYDNIDIPTLISDLRACGVSSEIVGKISGCLNKWCLVQGKGVPQGNSASDLLAKLYLDTVDVGLVNQGFEHLRYVDDIRLFCRNVGQAKKALMALSRLLRKRGLNLQSAKTRIITSKEALNEIESVQPIIERVTNRINEEIFSIFNSASYNIELTDDDSTPVEIVKETMSTYFINAKDELFDKTLFHFLINRLIELKESFALDYCLSILVEHPEETEYILKYSKSFTESEEDVATLIKMSERLLEFLVSEDAVYDYQAYQILEWMRANLKLPSEKLLTVARAYAFENNKPYYLRSVARNILGDFGNHADIDRLEECIQASAADTEIAELVCCVSKMEKARRNSFLGRLSKGRALVDMSVAYIKSNF